MKKKISRKNFIQGFASACGIVALNPSTLLAGTKTASGRIISLNGDKTYSLANENEQIRGSWVRHGASKKGDIILSNKRNVCQIVIDSNEHSSVQQAGRFLASDIKKITGFQPQIVEKVNENRNLTAIRLKTFANGSLPKNIHANKLKGEWESFRVITEGNDVWLIGANFRGTAFAAYELAERLGIDPLYIWTGYKPKVFKTLILKKTDYYQAPPIIKYRGLFHDDEDILPRPFDRKGHPLFLGDVFLRWYKRYFETGLRLKMNMVAPYTRTHRRYEVQKTASDWGLIYTSHHYDLLLSNPYGFKRFNLAKKRHVKPEWNWSKNKEGMIKYWEGGVLDNKSLNCIWPVGLRGTNDLSYKFPKGDTLKSEGRMYHNIIEIQRKLVKNNLPPDSNPLFTLTLYTEMLKKYQEEKKEFDLPKDVVVVWSDNNDGTMRALPKRDSTTKNGVYYHLSYLGPRHITKQITHAVPPKRIAEQFKNIISSEATEFCLVNVSELRNYIMGARMIARIAWDHETVLDNDNPSEHYINWWAKEYFGKRAASQAKKVYNQYNQLINKPTMLWYGSDMVQELIGKLIDKYAGKPVIPIDSNKLEILKERNDRYQATMDIARRAKQKMSREQKQYFFENALMGLLIDWRPTQAALRLNESLNETDRQRAWILIESAIKPLEQLELEIKKAERPPFENWYRETWIRTKLSPYNVHRPYEQVRAFITSGGMEQLQSTKDGIKHEQGIKEDQIWADFLDNSDLVKEG